MVQETRLCLEGGTEALFALLSPQWKLLYAAIDTNQGSLECLDGWMLLYSMLEKVYLVSVPVLVPALFSIS
jgi:hypothetical protein